MKKKQSNDRKQNKFINRELSWLEFNSRVLDEALSPETPLLDRLKFLAIFSTNLDEFFMVRVAGLRKMRKEGMTTCESPDQSPISTVLLDLEKNTRSLIQKQHECLGEILPQLQRHGVIIEKFDNLEVKQKDTLKKYFETEVFPVLTPLATDSSHPFPSIPNMSFSLVVSFKGHTKSMVPPIGFVEIPAILPRLVPIKKEDFTFAYVLLEDLIAHHLEKLFLGYNVNESWTMKLTRNLDYNLLENNVVNLLHSIQKEIISREQQEAVRLEIDENTPSWITNIFKENLHLTDHEIYRIPAPLSIPGLMTLYGLPLEELKEKPFNPRIPPQLTSQDNIFNVLSKKDLLVHHPYESFYAVVEFLNAAASDDDVLAIKQTLYRTSGDSPIIDALIRAAEGGKKVVAVIELKARFDEKNNIVWARRLERAGVNVVYGFVNLKTHCKTTLVVRKERQKIKRYVHLSTGNYNSQTAKIYTDIGYFTSNEAIGQDVSILFNLLTGFNILSVQDQNKTNIPELNFKKLSVAPVTLRRDILNLIEGEIQSHKKNKNGKITAKINGLVDKDIIEKLYEASRLGLKITLIVRGICCLRPGVKGLSENITVISIIDRFLEHSRIYSFYNNGNEKMFLSSADWMTRNMQRRIEIMFPIEDDYAKERLSTILDIYTKDNTKARILLSDGTYKMKAPKTKEKRIRAQQKLIEMVREKGLKSIPYEKALRHDSSKKKGGHPVAKGTPTKRKNP